MKSAFHGSGYRTFKEFYTLQVLPHWGNAFPHLVSYTRFVELMPWSLMLLCCFSQTRRGEITGISFIDSTPIEVCHPCHSKSHRVFEGLVGWSKNSVGWHYGFKLHLIINERGELLAFQLTPGNVDDRKPVPDLTQDLIGQLQRQGVEVKARITRNSVVQGISYRLEGVKFPGHRLGDASFPKLMQKRGVRYEAHRDLLALRKATAGEIVEVQPSLRDEISRRKGKKKKDVQPEL